MKKYGVAVVGASGMVGGELLGLLESRRFPVGEFYPFNSGRAPASVVFRGKKYPCAAPTLAALKKADLVFFVSTDEVAARFAPRLAAAGVRCIDDSSMFRLAAGVPLVIPEVNGGELKPVSRLIAGPNCTITGAAVALAGVHRRFRVTELRLATYQAVSGAGKGAMRQLEEELRAYFKAGRGPRPGDRRLPGPIAFNVLPQVGGFDTEGSSSEENKVRAELRKIWGDGKIRISCTAVRVPVLRGHSLAVWFKTARPCSATVLKRELARTPGLKFHARPGDYPTPLADGTRTDVVHAGRLRPGAVPGEYQLWIVSDNLYKGAALNSVQIAEQLVRF